MADERDLRTRIVESPFYVLGLKPSCSRADVEREGQKLLGMLELGLSAAKQYATPLGPQERTPEKVREAMAALRDPDRRLREELWARRDPNLPAIDPPKVEGRQPEGWRDALRALGWKA